MNQAGHWTNDELLASLYGIGPTDGHLAACADCAARLAGMQANREDIDLAGTARDGVSVAFLAAQRRAIYQRMSQRAPWWNAGIIRRWAAGLTTACVLGGSLFLYEQNQERKLVQERANDAKLVQEVASMANDTASPSMAPLEGLFE